jgi:hypothetical protein
MLDFIKKHGALLPLLLLLMLFIYGITYHRDTNYACKKNFAEYVSYPANGIVAEKYIDTHNHYLANIVVKNYKGGGTRFILNLDISHLYDSLEVGYRFKKDAGDPKVRYGKNALDKELMLDFGCKE